MDTPNDGAPEGLPPQIAHLTWDTLVQQSVSVTQSFVARMRELSRGVMPIGEDEPIEGEVVLESFPESIQRE